MRGHTPPRRHPRIRARIRTPTGWPPTRASTRVARSPSAAARGRPRDGPRGAPQMDRGAAAAATTSRGADGCHDKSRRRRGCDVDLRKTPARASGTRTAPRARHARARPSSGPCPRRRGWPRACLLSRCPRRSTRQRRRASRPLFATAAACPRASRAWGCSRKHRRPRCSACSSRPSSAWTSSGAARRGNRTAPSSGGSRRRRTVRRGSSEGDRTRGVDEDPEEELTGWCGPTVFAGRIAAPPRGAIQIAARPRGAAARIFGPERTPEGVAPRSSRGGSRRRRGARVGADRGDAAGRRRADRPRATRSSSPDGGAGPKRRRSASVEAGPSERSVPAGCARVAPRAATRTSTRTWSRTTTARPTLTAPCSSASARPRTSTRKGSSRGPRASNSCCESSARFLRASRL